ncbi:MAG: PPC domain-containing protein [Planctomycetes bacterium]|nr:PPC domain-containing protein [Planctomycetota bacterium]
MNSVFPPGGSVGESVEVTIAGSALDGVTALRCSAPGISFEQVESKKNQFRVSIAPDTPLGYYDLRAICNNGLSSPRPFVIGNRPEQLEPEANEDLQAAPLVPLNTVINGRIDKPADLDCFRFEARQGQRVLIECAAERIDSQLRAVLEVFDHQGQHLLSSRGYFGVDPLIDFRVPADGAYIVKIYDLTYTGSPDHYYRIDIDTGPRVAFAIPTVVQQGKSAQVTLYGWNLTTQEASVAAQQSDSSFDQIEVDIPVDMVREAWPLLFRMQPAQASIRGFTYHLPCSHAPVLISVTDVPVATDESNNHSPDTAKQIVYPCEVSGQLAAGAEQDWFAIDARRGEVLYIEGISQRINSPADLDVRVLDATAQQELVRFGDEVRNIGGKSFPTNHLDPAGRWRVPADGRYLILVRDVIGGSQSDPRRTYRLSIRREEPDVSLAVVPHRGDPAGVNVNRGGRTLLDLIALRRRGLSDSIRVSAKNLAAGITCPDVWLGPGVDRAPLVISAEPGAPEFVGELALEGIADMTLSRQVRGGVVVRSGSPNGWGRLTSEIPLAITGDAPIQISANGHETRDHQLYGELEVRHSPGSILDVAVYVQRSDTGHQAELKLTGVGLPDLIDNQAVTIPPGNDKGYISFYLPPSLPVGRYSVAVQGETTVPISDGKTEAVIVYSNVVTFEVHQPAFHIEIDRFAPQRIKRGEVLQVNYSAHRLNGFITKIHTELAQPGMVTDVVGLRGRGVTFVGQTETGTIQIIANDDAPLGQQPFLRLYGVGVLEDKPLFHGSCFLNLEVVE